MSSSRTRAARRLLLAVTTIQLAGCTYWGQPAATAPEPNGGPVRIWQGGKATVLRNVTFTPDSLAGIRRGEKTRLAVARGEIDSLNVRRPNFVGTVLLIGLAAGLVALIQFAIDFGSYANN